MGGGGIKNKDQLGLAKAEVEAVVDNILSIIEADILVMYITIKLHKCFHIAKIKIF